jgi:spore germination protein YaaH
MAHHPRRPAAACLAAVLLVLAAAPVAAVDPSPEPTPEAADGGGSTSPPSIHAEMESQHAATPLSFVSGARPMGLQAHGVDGGDVQAETAALPNGLSHEVFGYLPYWAVTDPLVAHLDYDLLSTIAYFGVPALSNGTLQKTGTGWNGWTSATMTDVINEAHAEGVKVVLTVTMMAWDYDYTEMSAVLNSSTRRARLANDIAATVAARNADGVNLDFEPMPNSLQSSYTAFVRAVRAALGSGSYLTVATTGGAASWDEGYDLAGLTAPDAANALMVMAYDLNWSGSARAGGVAPIDSPYALDSREAMAAFRARVPSSKLIWGVPYYGRAWTTTTKTVNGRTCASAGGCTAASWAMRYVDALEGAADHGRRWDATGQVPWYTYRSSTYGTHVQAYYDDAQSLDVKYEMVTANGLRGVGIWHLLMDVGRRALWDQLWRNFGDLPFRDVDDSAFLRDIIWISEAGITTGCGVARFCPSEAVSRGQMATFLDRAFNPPGPAPDRFTDDDESVHEPAINRIAKAGITTGCGRGRFCPDREVTRAQMATFLDRALDLPSTSEDFFDDDEGSPHERAINRVAAAGITTGCGSGRFCPDRAVRREQMAAFLHRALTR